MKTSRKGERATVGKIDKSRRGERLFQGWRYLRYGLRLRNVCANRIANLGHRLDVGRFS